MAKVELEIKGDIRAMRLEPGDVVVARVPSDTFEVMTTEEQVSLHDALQDVFDGHEVVVLAGPIELEQYRP